MQSNCKIQQALEMFKIFFDEIDEVVYIVDLEKKQILYANAKAKGLFGKKIIGRKCYETFYNRSIPCSFCREVHEKPFARELQDPRNKRWYKCICKTIKLSRDKLVKFGVAIDITEQKTLKQALREQEERCCNMIDELPIVIYTLSKDKKITSLNPTFERITGWKCEDWIGKEFMPLIHPDDLPLAMRMFRKTLRGENCFPFELRILTKSGKFIVGEFTILPFIKNGKIVGKFGTISNITERKRLEEELKERERIYRCIIESSHSGLMIVNDKFTFTYVNDELCNILGYHRDEIIGQDFRKFLDEESIPLVVDRDLRRQRGEKVPSKYEFKIVRKDGEKRFVEIRSIAVPDKEGKMLTIAQILDITEKKRFEERLSALNRYGQSLSMTKSMEEIYRLTLEAMEKILGFEFSDIFIVEGDTLSLKYHKGYSNISSVKLKLNGKRGITVKAVKLGKSILIPDVREEKNYVKSAENIRSELAVPIKIEDKVIGILNVESAKLFGFSENDKKLLEILASHAAIAITNLKRQQTLSALNEYAQNLNKAQKLTEIYEIALDAMEKILGFEYASIFMIQGKILKLVAQRKYSKKLKVSLPLEGKKGITVKAAKTGKSILVPDVRKDDLYVKAGVKGMLSELAVPIKIGKKVLGVLNVESKRVAAFSQNDKALLETLASHAATAIANLERRERLQELSRKIANLMESSTRIMRVKDMHKRLKVIARAIQNFGWRRVVISLRDENLEGTDIVTVGLTKEERRLLIERKAPGHVWRERLGQKFERFKIGEFYYLPWNDPWIREYIHGIPPESSLEEATTYAGVPSRLSPEEMVDWHPQDMIYAPLRTPEGKIVGILSMDDPVDGRKPTKESLIPLELFLHQAAITIENFQLIESLRMARKKLEEYTQTLEQRVEERTRELRESQEKLLKAQKLAVIGELAGMVGHDLRNPLTSIAGAQYYLKKKLTSRIDGKVMEMLELIEKNIAYSNKIINDLLEYSREIEVELQETTPKTVLEEALDLIKIPKKVQLKKYVRNTPKIWVDIGKMKRVFVNIIKNALDAMLQGGILEITSKKRKDKIEFRFADSGVGMSEEVLEKLWTPLFTTKAKGMGFGLPICKRIVEAHGGSIFVESKIGKGTIFTVVVPIKPKVKKGGEKIWMKMLESSLLTTTKT
jgi:PAS domain S-box-containing protein